MKYRNSFVSNSSSSSFIIIDDPSGIPNTVNYIKLHKKFAKEVIKDLFQKRQEDVKLGCLSSATVAWEPDQDVYLTEFISDARGDYNFTTTGKQYEYINGGHGGPYNEEEFTPLNTADLFGFGQIWIPNYIYNQAKYPTGQLEFEFVQNELDLKKNSP